MYMEILQVTESQNFKTYKDDMSQLLEKANCYYLGKNNLDTYQHVPSSSQRKKITLDEFASNESLRRILGSVHKKEQDEQEEEMKEKQKSLLTLYEQLKKTPDNQKLLKEYISLLDGFKSTEKCGPAQGYSIPKKVPEIVKENIIANSGKKKMTKVKKDAVAPKTKPKVETSNAVAPKTKPKVETSNAVVPKVKPKVETSNAVVPKVKPKVETSNAVVPKVKPKEIIVEQNNKPILIQILKQALGHKVKFSSLDECNTRANSKPFYMSKDEIVQLIKDTPALKKEFPKLSSMTKADICKVLFA
jgi:hypothetical protein